MTSCCGCQSWVCPAGRGSTGRAGRVSEHPWRVGGHREGPSCGDVTQRGCRGAHSQHKASRHFPAWSAPTLPPGPYEMQPVLAPCPLPSSHQLGTASSLCWQSSSRRTASSCIQRPALPSFPRLAEPRLEASAASIPVPAWGAAGHAWPCWGGWGAKQSRSFGSGFALGTIALAPSESLRWVGLGWKGWAGRGAALPAGCGPGLTLPRLSGSACGGRRQGLHVL